jgi:ATP-dependent Clp protease ATP-binding subunit ClpC
MIENGLPRVNGEHMANLKPVEEEFSQIDEVAEELGKTVFGQTEAMTSIARLLVRSESSMRPPTRPMGSVLLLGLTGVGKTETANAIAKYLHKEEGADEWRRHIYKVDCSKLSERHMVAELIGAPPGYVGYGNDLILPFQELANGTENVIVWDEIEKANPAVWKLLLPVMDEARLQVRMRVGQTIGSYDVPFNNIFNVFTSNIGTGMMTDELKSGGPIGFNRPTEGQSVSRMSSLAMSELHSTFQYMPEFPARMDEIIVFKPLERDSYFAILDKFNVAVGEANMKIEMPFPVLTDECREHLVDMATRDKRFGAREIRNVFNADIVSKLSDLVISNHEVADSHYVVIHWTGEKYQPYIVPNQAPRVRKSKEETIPLPEINEETQKEPVTPMSLM